MREREFRRYLGPRLGARSVDSYIAYCRRFEGELGRNLDTCDISDVALSSLAREFGLRGINSNSLRNCLSAVRSYRNFRSSGQDHFQPYGPSSNGASFPVRRVRKAPPRQSPTGGEVLSNATAEFGIDLVALVARCTVWANPIVVADVMRDDAAAAWFPRFRRFRPGETRGAVVDGVRLDDNSYASQAGRVPFGGVARGG